MGNEHVRTPTVDIKLKKALQYTKMDNEHVRNISNWYQWGIGTIIGKNGWWTCEQNSLSSNIYIYVYRGNHK